MVSGLQTHHEYHALISWLIGAAAVVLLYLSLTAVYALLEVKAAPREPMYWCPKHGMMRSAHLLHLPGFNESDPTSGYCPLCFDENLKKAEGSGKLPWDRGR